MKVVTLMCCSETDFAWLCDLVILKELIFHFGFVNKNFHNETYKLAIKLG